MLYLDDASTTLPNPSLLKRYVELTEQFFINSDAKYKQAIELKKMYQEAIKTLPSLLNLKGYRSIMTSGATEANNLAIFGYLEAYPQRGKHIVCSSIEHASVKTCFEYLKTKGYRMTMLEVDQAGVVSLEQLKQVVTKDTALVSIMAVNHEVGSMMPIQEIAQYLKQFPTLVFHVDAVQAIGKVKINYQDVDMITLSAHKNGGLKGSGCLLVAQKLQLAPLIKGGQQQDGWRAGTRDVIKDYLLIETIRLAWDHYTRYQDHVCAMHALFISLLSSIEGVIVNVTNGSPYIINFSVLGYEPDVLIRQLDCLGFQVSSRSTCDLRKQSLSDVLKAMGVNPLQASSSIRVSYHHTLEATDIEHFIEALKQCMMLLKRGKKHGN